MIDDLGSRHFDEPVHARFANLSGDLNPMHVDAVAARRTQAGAPVVHGIHVLLWALDTLAKNGNLVGTPVSLDVRFQNFVYVGDVAVLRISNDNSAKLRCTVAVDGLTVIALSIKPNAPAGSYRAPPCSRTRNRSLPRALSFDEARDDEGCVDIPHPFELAQMFPDLTARFGTAPAASIASLSTLVGMVCPGLYSIFASLTVTLYGERDISALAYTVTALEERFRLMEIAVSGSGVTGSISAFMRHPPVRQPSFASLSTRVSPHAYAGVRALIVGGSRGLGALTASMIAAGGGNVTVTYNVGEAEARALSDEIGSRQCRALHYDARLEAATQLATLPRDVNQLYYFATAQIYRAKGRAFDAQRLREFIALYVDGFADVCLAIRAGCEIGLSAFYPSTIYVEDPPRDMVEYAMAKAAGEILCSNLDRSVNGLRVVWGRLPRLLTDQTAGVTAGPLHDPVDVMLPYLGRMLDSREPGTKA